MGLFKKIYNYIKGYQRKKLLARRIATIKNNTLNLKTKKQSDTGRWQDSKELYEDWNERTAILARLVHPGSSVIEFGAGNMSLRKELPENCTYTPSDIVKRTDDTIVCDLNNPISFELFVYNTAVFSGVLEYVYDVDAVFKALQPHIHYIILSYACSDTCRHNRLAQGWLSDYSEGQLLEIFARFKYEVKGKQEWRQQTIFNLEKIIS
jgi:hypothetical protein